MTIYPSTMDTKFGSISWKEVQTLHLDGTPREGVSGEWSMHS